MAERIHLPTPVTPPEILERARQAANILRPHIGKYVGRRGDTVLVAADTPAEVIRWLREHDTMDAVVFMVPKNPVTLTNDV